MLPEEIWRALRLKPEREVEFTLADGTPITRGVSECRFEIRGAAATSPVVLGEEHDGALLGAVTLETLGFMLNPLTREILPMRMALSNLRRSKLAEPSGCRRWPPPRHSDYVAIPFMVRSGSTTIMLKSQSF